MPLEFRQLEFLQLELLFLFIAKTEEIAKNLM